nr:hypothetical protein [Tanacetum cinerariifolium]
MHPNRGRIEAIDADEDITLVDMETEVNLGAELQGRLEEKDEVNAANKEVNLAEPIPNRDEEPTKKRIAEETLLQESFKKLRVGVKVLEHPDALWRMVKEKFNTTVPTVDKEKALWVELKRLFEPDADDVIWKLQRERLSLIKRSHDLDAEYKVIKEYSKKDKIRSKPDKNGKRGEAKKSLK